jgi:hypothetical protein
MARQRAAQYTKTKILEKQAVLCAINFGRARFQRVGGRLSSFTLETCIGLRCG